MPGHEGEYEAFDAVQADSGGGGAPAYAPLPVDDDRRSRSPGLQHNFYDASTAEFKKPYGGAGGGGASPALSADGPPFTDAPPPPPPPPPPLPLPAAGEGASYNPAATTGRGGPLTAETPVPAWALKRLEAAAAKGGALQARVAFLEAALAEEKAHKEAARKEAAEARAREEALSRRLSAAEARLFAQLDGEPRRPPPPRLSLAHLSQRARASRRAEAAAGGARRARSQAAHATAAAGEGGDVGAARRRGGRGRGFWQQRG